MFSVVEGQRTHKTQLISNVFCVGGATNPENTVVLKHVRRIYVKYTMRPGHYFSPTTQPLKNTEARKAPSGVQCLLC